MFRFLLYSILFTLIVLVFIPIHYVAKDLQPYVDTIMDITNVECSEDQYWLPNKTFIYFDDFSKSKYIGMCQVMPHKFIIKIDHSYFENATEDERLAVIAHELHHCLFNDPEHSINPYNYKNAVLPEISKAVLYRQVIRDLENSCKSKVRIGGN